MSETIKKKASLSLYQDLLTKNMESKGRQQQLDSPINPTASSSKTLLNKDHSFLKQLNQLPSEIKILKPSASASCLQKSNGSSSAPGGAKRLSTSLAPANSSQSLPQAPAKKTFKELMKIAKAIKPTGLLEASRPSPPPQQIQQKYPSTASSANGGSSSSGGRPLGTGSVSSSSRLMQQQQSTPSQQRPQQQQPRPAGSDYGSATTSLNSSSFNRPMSKSQKQLIKHRPVAAAPKSRTSSAKSIPRGTEFVMLNTVKRDRATVEEIADEISARKKLRTQGQEGAGGGGKVMERELPYSNVNGEQDVIANTRPNGGGGSARLPPSSNGGPSKQKLYEQQQLSAKFQGGATMNRPQQSQQQQPRASVPTKQSLRPSDAGRQDRDRARVRDPPRRPTDRDQDRRSTSQPPRGTRNGNESFVSKEIASLFPSRYGAQRREEEYYSDDSSDMEAGYHETLAEENRSSKLGKMEDAKEEGRLRRREEEKRRMRLGGD